MSVTGLGVLFRLGGMGLKCMLCLHYAIASVEGGQLEGVLLEVMHRCKRYDRAVHLLELHGAAAAAGE